MKKEMKKKLGLSILSLPVVHNLLPRNVSIAAYDAIHVVQVLPALDENGLKQRRLKHTTVVHYS